MTAKEFLNKIRDIDLLIDEKLADVQELRDRLTNITANCEGERVQTSKLGDKFADTIAKIVDLENELQVCITQGIRCRREFEEIISKLTSPQEYEVMHRHYVQFQSFGRIAKEMHFSKSAIAKIHKRILQKVYDCPQSAR